MYYNLPSTLQYTLKCTSQYIIFFTVLDCAIEDLDPPQSPIHVYSKYTSHAGIGITAVHFHFVMLVYSIRVFAKQPNFIIQLNFFSKKIKSNFVVCDSAKFIKSKLD